MDEIHVCARNDDEESRKKTAIFLKRFHDLLAINDWWVKVTGHDFAKSREYIV